VFTAVYLGFVSPSSTYIATLLLHNIVKIEPALQVSATKLVFGVLFVAGPLAGFLDLDFVIGELFGGIRLSSHPSCSQIACPHDVRALRPLQVKRILPYRFVRDQNGRHWG
jgi:hypothetical protein